MVFQMIDPHFSKKHQDVECKAAKLQQTPRSLLRQIFRKTKLYTEL